jgi:hypothetical protein
MELYLKIGMGVTVGLVLGCMYRYSKGNAIDKTDYEMLIILPWIWPVLPFLLVCGIWKKFLSSK